ncbi:hypothetical protein [Ruegeria sp. MALMAid1280]|uniref:hypothetical protein n=1 Tax=Ruegeria sp. MALMAid1280 TaxID=3411634 RepID=UPI003BA3523A
MTASNKISILKKTLAKQGLSTNDNTSITVFATLTLLVDASMWKFQQERSQHDDPQPHDDPATFWEAHYAKMTKPAGGRPSAILVCIAFAKPKDHSFI